jgi:hypothetical protein
MISDFAVFFFAFPVVYRKFASGTLGDILCERSLSPPMQPCSPAKSIKVNEPQTKGNEALCHQFIACRLLLCELLFYTQKIKWACYSNAYAK